MSGLLPLPDTGPPQTWTSRWSVTTEPEPSDRPRTTAVGDRTSSSSTSRRPTPRPPSSRVRCSSDWGSDPVGPVLWEVGDGVPPESLRGIPVSLPLSRELPVKGGNHRN